MLTRRRTAGRLPFRALEDPTTSTRSSSRRPTTGTLQPRILALQAGKHVYVEKPCGHNPREGELLVEAQKRYGHVVQMGNQQRSASRRRSKSSSAIREGVIGRPYLRPRLVREHARLDRARQVGEGPEPDWLDYELWQGPAAARRPSVTTSSTTTGTGSGAGARAKSVTTAPTRSTCAAGRSGSTFPMKVTSAGGRYHFDDDWEMYDTQIASFEFAGRQARSPGRAQLQRDGRSRVEAAAASIHGEKGTVILDRNGYVVYDNEGREIDRDMLEGDEDAMDTRGGGRMTGAHVANFVAAIRGLESPRAPIDDAYKSVHLCHLGNIAHRTGHALRCDTANGRIVGDPDAEELWSRDYEPGWEPAV